MNYTAITLKNIPGPGEPPIPSFFGAAYITIPANTQDDGKDQEGHGGISTALAIRYPDFVMPGAVCAAGELSSVHHDEDADSRKDQEGHGGTSTALAIRYPDFVMPGAVCAAGELSSVHHDEDADSGKGGDFHDHEGSGSGFEELGYTEHLE